jgi:hypothetical protein
MRRNPLPAALTSAFLYLAVAGGVSLILPAEAMAQDEAEIKEARAKFQKAIELKAAKNWGGALKLFRDVGQIKMTPQVRYHIATCEENLGQLVTALGGYELALAQAEGMHPDFLAEVQGSIDDLNARIPKIVIERGEGAEAASIELDGVALGESSIGGETPVNPGPHSVTAQSPGYENYRETVNVAEGAVEVLQVEMVPLEEGSSGGGGGVAPLPDDPEAEAKKKKKLRTMGLITGGAGVGVAAIGGVFLGLSQGKVGKLKDLCGEDLDCRGLSGPDLTEAESLDGSAHTMEAVGWVGVGLGVAAIGTGVVLFVMGSSKDKEDVATRGLSFKPYAPSSDAGFSLVGSF